MGKIGKITELVVSSKVSIEDAVKKAAKELGKREKDLRGIKIKNVSAIIKNGEVVEWRVNLKVSSEM